MEEQEQADVVVWDAPYDEFVNTIDRILNKAASRQRRLNIPLRFGFPSMEYFYSHFECTRCGKCCTERPITDKEDEYVALTPDEFERLKELLPQCGKKLRTEEIKDELFGYPICMLTYKIDYPCPLFRDNACIVYESRPLVCRMYPLGEPFKKAPDKFTVNTKCPAAVKRAKEIMILAYIERRKKRDTGS